MLNFIQFMEIAKNSPAELNRPKPYLQDHSIRFYETYKACDKLVNSDSKLLSIGAGRAFVEYVLADQKSLSVTVFDFEEAVERNLDQYEVFGFEKICGNFLTDTTRIDRAKYDLIIFCEILEHIPLSPTDQIKKLLSHLKPGGHIVITTPNITNLSNRLKILSGKNIVASAERLFSPVCIENESVHRREYTKKEIREYLTSLGLEVATDKYILSKKPNFRIRSLANYGVSKMFSSLKPMMLLVAKSQ